MSTLNTSIYPYCNIAIFLEKFDYRTVGDYLSDTDQRLTPIEITNSTVLLHLLLEASGYVESLAQKGTRYSHDDLFLIANLDPIGGQPKSPTNATAQMMYGIVAGIAMFYLWERRPLRLSEHKMSRRSEWALMMTEALGNGDAIFGLLEVAEAGLPTPQFMTPQQIRYRNFTSNQAQRYFGDRAQFQVPGP